MGDVLTEFGLVLLNKAGLLLIVVIVDLIGGILIAWKNKTFKLEKLPEFLQGLALYVWAWIAAELLAFAPKLLGVEVVAGWTEMLTEYTGDAVYWGVLTLKYGASIVGHIAAVLKNQAFRDVVGVVGIQPTNPKDAG